MAYGLEVYGPDGTTLVWSAGLRTMNIETFANTGALAAGASITFNCTNANDPTKIVIAFKEFRRGLYVSATTATTFTITNSLNTTAAGVDVMAIRVA